MNPKLNGHDQIPLNQVCCFNCGHSVVQEPRPPDIVKIRVCKYLPPTPIVKRNFQSGIVGVTALSPPVADGDFCAQFAPNEMVCAAARQAANEAGVDDVPKPV